MTSIRVLGPLVVMGSDGIEQVLTGRTGQIVAALALRVGRPVDDDELIDALWPGDGLPSEPAATLRTYVARARRTVAAVGIERLGGRYLVDIDPSDVDATVFEQRVTGGLGAWRAGDPVRCSSEMTAALDLWKGRPWTLLDGWAPADIDAARLGELHAQAEEYSAASELVEGDAESAASHLIELTEAAPLREFRWELLMRAQAIQGRQADALRTFRRARDLLVDELGIEPSPRLVALEAAVLDQRDPVPLARPAAAEPDGVSRSARLERRAAESLVGRDEHMATLDDALATHDPAVPRIVAISGEPGIGKTRLLDATAELARDRRLAVHRGVCFEAESSGAYRPVIDVLRSLVDEFPPPDVDRLLLGILLPELVSAGERLGDGGDDTQFRLFDAAARLFRRAAEAGSVIMIDDMHSADPASIDLIGHCVRHASDVDLKLVVAYRPREAAVHSPLVEWLATAGRLVDTTRIELSGLSDAGVAQLMRRIVGSDDDLLATELRDLTEGNPLFVHELLVALRDSPRSLDELVAELPAGLVDVLNHRLATVGSDHQSILRRVSIDPAGMSFELLRASVSFENGRLVDLLDDLTEAGLLVERLDDGDPVLAFSHELLRVAMRDGLSLARRAALHHATALAADQLADADPHRWTGAAAFHWFEAGRAADPLRAELTNIDAGRLAYERTAFADAQRCWGRALTALEWQGREDRGGRLHLSAAESAHRSGDVDLRRRYAETSFDLAMAEGDVATAARAAIVHGGTRSTYGVANENTTRMLAEAMDRLEGRSDLVGLRACAMARLAQEVNHAGDLDASRDMSADAVDLARGVDDDRVAASVFRERVWTLNHPDWLSEREAAIEAMLERSRRVGDVELEMEARVWRASARLERGDTGAFDIELDELDSLAERCPVPALLVRVATLKSTRSALRGDVDLAIERAQQTYELGQRVEPENAEQVLRAQMIAPLREQGLLAAALPLVAESAESYREIPGWRCALAFVLAEAGERDAAAGEVAALRSAGFAAIRRDLAWALAVTYLAEAVAILEDRDAAEELEPLLAPFSGRIASLWDIASNGAVDHYLGRLAMTRGDAASAVHHFEAAVDLNVASDHGPAALRSRTQRVIAGDGSGALDPLEGVDELAVVIESGRHNGWPSIVEGAEALLSTLR